MKNSFLLERFSNNSSYLDIDRQTIIFIFKQEKKQSKTNIGKKKKKKPKTIEKEVKNFRQNIIKRTFDLYFQIQTLN